MPPDVWPTSAPVLTDGVITLRLPTAADIDQVMAACQDPEIAHWTVIPWPYAREHAVGFVESALPDYESGKRVPYVIADATTDELLGSSGLHGIDLATGVGECGYWVGRPHRGRGVATRAVRLQIQAAPLFGLRRIELLVEEANTASIAVVRAAGCIDTGEIRDNVMRGELRHHQVWAHV
jgi:RimJ/RimL family protein N-acetyltransferase